MAPACLARRNRRVSQDDPRAPMLQGQRDTVAGLLSYSRIGFGLPRTVKSRQSIWYLRWR